VTLLARSLRTDIKHLQDTMISSILKDTSYLLTPLKEFVPDRGHEVMALLLDPRFCHGNFFLDAAPPATDDRDRKRAAKALMRTYNDHVLKPALTQLAKFMRQEEQHPSGEGALNANDRRALCDEDSDDDNGNDEGNGDQDDVLLNSRVEEELRSFRSTCVPDADKTVLEWWKGHKSDFPLVAELARIVLAVPASQIECERVFSAAGLITQHLRNRMGVENMSIQVFLLKNMDVNVDIKAILESTYSASVYQSSLANDLSFLSDLAEARLRLKELEDAPSPFSNQQEVEYELELGVATENILLENDADLA